jgi:general secretion pathway protein D
VPVLRPLIAPNNIVVAYPNNNTLVVTDYASNLKRIEQIVYAIDQPGKGAPQIIPIKKASAIELAQTINRILQDGSAAVTGVSYASQRFLLMADPRTNSLILRAENKERIDLVHDLIKKLDVGTGTPGNIHVVYLKNAEAVKLAVTLRSVLSGDTSAAAAAAAGAAQGGAPAAPGAAAAPSGGGVIQADAATNSLIITAPTNVYNNMRAVIDQLDVRRAQVFVEALIVEVAVTKDADFGIQWLTGSNVNSQGVQAAGGTNFGTGSNNLLGIAAGFAAGAPTLSAGLNVGVVRNGSLGLLLRGLQTDTDANILSTPNLMMLDNEEAKIVIGQNVPFITGTQIGTATNPNPFQTIERRDVGLTLKIKPQISEGGTVKMVIFQEVSTVQNLNNPAGVITDKRSLDSTVLVDDGQTLVLGGLIQDQVNKGEFKVPLLGDIPFLGWLFRYETRKSSKTNLMIFIRPSILRTALAAQGLTQEKYDFIRTQQEQNPVPWHLVLPSMPAPILPEIKPVSGVAATAPASAPAVAPTQEDAADAPAAVAP